ncbi:MAG: hypothetical protein CH6_3733 [Candidatus Kapaibacterium sp.]|nr:MAG: hypothetical protein CH6_3733 [Candidatus Kapabacteria bacterium]
MFKKSTLLLALFILLFLAGNVFSQEQSPYGKVLTLDENGTQQWIYVWDIIGGGGNSWLLNGNSISEGNFLGTTNDQPLVLKVNNTHAMSFYYVTDEENGYVNIVGGSESNSIVNSYSSVIVGGGVTDPDEDPPGENYIEYSLSSIIGAGYWNQINNASSSGIMAGKGNTVWANYCFIGGGKFNIAGLYDAGYYEGDLSGILGGERNYTRGNNSMAVGSFLETVSYSEIVLGLYNSNDGYEGDFETYQSDDRLLVVGNGSSYVSRSNSLVMLKNGKTAIGSNVATPTSTLDLQGVYGYNQLRLRTSYTPTGTDDTNGEVGDVAWDDDYLYIKTSAGWKRVALSTW